MPSVIGQDSSTSGFEPGLADPPITFGVWGDSGNGTGLLGSSSHSAPATAPTEPGGGAGVHGLHTAAGGVGVRGQADHQTAIAVLGSSAHGTGISGASTEGTGVTAVTASGTALHARRQMTGGALIEARLATPQFAGDFAGDVQMSGTLAIGGKLVVGATEPAPDHAAELLARADGSVELNLLSTGVSRPALRVDGSSADVVAASGVQLSGPAGGRTYRMSSGADGKWHLADQTSQVDRLVIDKAGNVAIGIGAGQAAGMLHVEGSEVHSGGSGGGFSFADRKVGTFVKDPDAGQRWMWYATDGSARLWSGSDRLTVTMTGADVMGSLSIHGQDSSQGSAGLDVDRGSSNEVALRLVSSGPGWGSGLQMSNKSAGASTYGMYSGADGKWHLADQTSQVDRLVIDKAGNVAIGIGAGQAAGMLHVEGSEVHSGGKAGGFSFADRKVGTFVKDPDAGQRWMWYATDGSARLWSGSDRLTVTMTGADVMGSLSIHGQDSSQGSAGLDVDRGSSNEVALRLVSSGPGWGSGLQMSNKSAGASTYGMYSGADGKWHLADQTSQVDRLVIDKAGNVAIGIGADQAARMLHVEGSEVHSSGKAGGFSFADRKVRSFVETPNAGQRWVWYATDGAASLWSGADRLTVTATGEGGGLDVSRRMRVRQGGDASAGIWFRQSGPNADRAFVGMADDTHVGFWGDTGAGWGLRMNTTTGQTTVASGSILNGVTVGCDSQTVDYPFEYETVGVKEANYNLRLQSPNWVIVHAQGEPRLSIHKDGADLVGSLSINGKEAMQGAEGDWLRLNQAAAFPSGVHTPGLFAPGSLNVGGHSGWGNPGNGNAWIAGTLHVEGEVRLGAADQKVYIGGNQDGPFIQFHDDLWFSDPQSGVIHLRNHNDTNWGKLRGEFQSPCSREYKRDIELLDRVELDDLLSDALRTEVVWFRWHGDSDTNRRRLGVIAEQLPRYLVDDDDGRGLSMPEYVTMLLGALQVLDARVSTLERGVDEADKQLSGRT